MSSNVTLNFSKGPNAPTSPNGNNHSGSSSLLSTLDFRSLEEMDPSIADGHRLVFDKEVPLELRTQDSSNNHNEGTLEAIRVKILVMGDEQDITNIRVELTSEADLFFHYVHSLNETSYQSLQQQQKLMIDFKGYPEVLSKMLNNCIKEPQSYLAVFVISSNGVGQLDFIQNLEYKFVELLSLAFQESPEQVIRQQISFRYNTLKGRVAMMQQRLQDVSALVKLKNPSLLLQLQRSPQPTPSSTPSSAIHSRSNSFTNLGSIFGHSSPMLKK